VAPISGVRALPASFMPIMDSPRYRTASWSLYATAPPDEMLERMFGKLSASNDPNKGGLAIDPPDFMSEAPHHA
jgi:hypothetical protein